MQGDALKVVLCIPYVLASKYQGYLNKPWDEPLIIRNGFGKKFEIRLVEDKIARYSYAEIQISEIPSDKNGFTEVEARIPYDPKLSQLSGIVNPDELCLVLIKYALLNPHIGFHFNVVTDHSSPPISGSTLAATQRLLTHASKKRSSIYSYDLASFENLIYSIADDNLIVYNVLLNNFREGSNLRKDDDLLISIGQLKKEGAGKIYDIFGRLRNAMPPPGLSHKSNKDLVPFDTKDREKAIAARLKQLGYNVPKIKYKAEFAYYNSSSEENNTHEGPLSTVHTQFPFLVEVAVIHTPDLSFNLFYCEGINGSPKNYYSFLQGDELIWTSNGGKQHVAHHVRELLEEYGYSDNIEKCKGSAVC
jgi:hypothetical protein